VQFDGKQESAPSSLDGANVGHAIGDNVGCAVVGLCVGAADGASV
jgi:hypothetical protein